MVILYFSGTGNSRYVAVKFASLMESKAYSIEDNVDFEGLLSSTETIGFCYPIYGSMVPLIMRNFVSMHKELLRDKKLILFCTQYLFSGDGARVFTDMLTGIDYEVIYAEHFFMPNNICNVPMLKISDESGILRYQQRADSKLASIRDDIRKGKVLKRGFNLFSQSIGFLGQRVYFARGERVSQKNLRISKSCVLCMKCVDCCPTDNLFLDGNKISHRGDCTLCFRCVNLCPKKSITVMTHSKVRKQYKGMGMPTINC